MPIDSNIPQGLVARFSRRLAIGAPFRLFKQSVCRLAGALAAAVADSEYAGPEKYNLVLGWVKGFIENMLPKIEWPSYLAWISYIPMNYQQQLVYLLLKGAIDASIEGVLGLLKEKK